MLRRSAISVAQHPARLSIVLVGGVIALPRKLPRIAGLIERHWLPCEETAFVCMTPSYNSMDAAVIAMIYIVAACLADCGNTRRPEGAEGGRCLRRPLPGKVQGTFANR